MREILVPYRSPEERGRRESLLYIGPMGIQSKYIYDTFWKRRKGFYSSSEPSTSSRVRL